MTEPRPRSPRAAPIGSSRAMTPGSAETTILSRTKSRTARQRRTPARPNSEAYGVELSHGRVLQRAAGAARLGGAGSWRPVGHGDRSSPHVGRVLAGELGVRALVPGRGQAAHRAADSSPGSG